MLLSDEHVAYQTEVRRFMDAVVRPAIAEYDLTQPLSSDALTELHNRFKVHEIAVVEPLREDGHPDLIATGIFTEELARVDSSIAHAFPALFFSDIPMRKLFDDEQAVAYAHLLEPGALISVGLSEPNVGSNPAGMETTARRDGESWIINGHKLWTSNATVSRGIIVACRLPDDGNQTAAFVVDRLDYNYSPRNIECIGWNGMSTCEVTFDDCRVPAVAQIGRAGDGLARMLSIAHIGRLNLSFSAVGVAQAAFDLAVQYARDRTQFGKPIGSFQLIQEMIVDMATDIHAGRLLAQRAAALVELGHPARAEVSIAKAFCTEMAVRVTSLGIQVHGAIGLTRECKAEQYFRDARMHTIPDGTTQIHKLIAGRELIGLSALR